MDAYNPAGWVPLFGAEVGAAAALAGLIFVAVSLNAPRIVATAFLPLRAGKALVLLLTVLGVATLVLVPGPPEVIGGLVLAAGLIGWILITNLDVRVLRRVEPEFRGVFSRTIPFGQTGTLAFVVAGAGLLFQAGGGLYWAVAGVLLATIGAVIDAWVLLVEILR